MNALPWYKSPVYIGVVVNLIAGLVNILNLQEVVTIEVINNAVATVFTVAGVVAAIIAEYKRRKSDIQPITFTAKKEEGFASIGMLVLLAILGAIALSACSVNPAAPAKLACASKSAYQLERCVKSIAETYDIYQQRAYELSIDPTTPEDVKELVRKADAVTTPVIVETLRAAKAYMQIRDEVAAGETTEEKLAIAEQNVRAFGKIAEERLAAFLRALNGEQTPGEIEFGKAAAAPATAAVTVSK